MGKPLCLGPELGAPRLGQPRLECCLVHVLERGLERPVEGVDDASCRRFESPGPTAAGGRGDRPLVAVHRNEGFEVLRPRPSVTSMGVLDHGEIRMARWNSVMTSAGAMLLLVMGCGSSEKSARSTSTVQGSLPLTSFDGAPDVVVAKDETGATTQAKVDAKGGFRLVLSKEHSYALAVSGAFDDEPVVYPRKDGSLDRGKEGPEAGQGQSRHDWDSRRSADAPWATSGRGPRSAGDSVRGALLSAREVKFLTACFSGALHSRRGLSLRYSLLIFLHHHLQGFVLRIVAFTVVN